MTIRRRSPGRAPRRVAGALVGVVLLAGSLAACGGSDESATVPGPHGSAPALWNPCDGLPLARMKQLFGADLTVATGTPTAPRCDFTPATKGDPAVNANYSLFSGSLGDLMDSFGTSSTTTNITKVAVPGSDGARLITQTRDKTFLLTGYVKDGRLVQTVNVVDPAPYRRKDLLAAIRQVLVLLSAHAVDSGLTGPDSGASVTDTPEPSSAPTGSVSPAS